MVPIIQMIYNYRRINNRTINIIITTDVPINYNVNKNNTKLLTIIIDIIVSTNINYIPILRCTTDIIVLIIIRIYEILIHIIYL